MSKEEIVSKALADIQAGQSQVLTDVIGAAVDQSAIEQKASDGTLGQADLDKAVADAVAPLNEKIAQDATDLQAAHADADAKLADVQSKLDVITADDVVKTKSVDDLKGSIAAMQAALDSIKALFSPAPVPAPEPSPAPVDPVPAA